MKSYTNLKQSKKLAKILPIESADMCFNDNEPCWSLAALLNILPHCIDDRYCLVSGKLSDNKGWYVMYDDFDHFTRFYVKHSDLIDACVEMILKLHEQKLI